MSFQEQTEPAGKENRLRRVSSFAKGIEVVSNNCFLKVHRFDIGCNYLTEAESPVARFGSVSKEGFAIRPTKSAKVTEF